MIADRLRERAETAGSDLFLITGTTLWTNAEAAEYVEAVARRLAGIGVGRLGVYLPDCPQVLYLCLAADAIGASICVLNYRLTAAEASSASRSLGLETVVVSEGHSAGLDVPTIPVETFENSHPGLPRDQALSSQDSSRALIMTSGTTGEPKAAVYRWRDLVAQVKLRPRFSNSRWLLCYNLNHFAGIQMFVHVLVNGAALAIPDNSEIRAILDCLRRYHVRFVSATPTFWRCFLASCTRDNLIGIDLEQLTIGGEAVSARELRGLSGLFPNARISQVYASTEAGSCFSVNDGKPGFPASLLSENRDGVQLRVVGDELQIRSSHAMVGLHGLQPRSKDGWWPSGDLVRIEGDRVLFLGRKTEAINVGGVKVHPNTVEQVILELPEVRSVRAYARANPVSGSIVVADVEPIHESGNEQLAAKIRLHCAARLDRYTRPRIVNVVNQLQVVNRKIARRIVSE